MEETMRSPEGESSSCRNVACI